MRCVFALVLVLIGLARVPAASAVPSSKPVPFPVVNGTVRALLVDGDTAYVGGHFSSVGNLTGPLAFVGLRDGKVRRGFPTIAGRALDEAREGWAGVRAVVPDGKGGLFVAGHFGRIAGKRRSALAHLRPDG